MCTNKSLYLLYWFEQVYPLSAKKILRAHTKLERANNYDAEKLIVTIGKVYHAKQASDDLRLNKKCIL